MGTTRKGQGSGEKAWGSAFAREASMANISGGTSNEPEVLRTQRHLPGGGLPPSSSSAQLPLRLPQTIFLKYSFSTCPGGVYCMLGTLLRDVMASKAPSAPSVVSWERWTHTQASLTYALADQGNAACGGAVGGASLVEMQWAGPDLGCWEGFLAKITPADWGPSENDLP